MTPVAFTAWVAEMKATHSLSERDLVRLLGTGSNQITRWKANGAPLYIELACAELSRRLKKKR